jgi:hypothetical protein
MVEVERSRVLAVSAVNAALFQLDAVNEVLALLAHLLQRIVPM